MNGIEYAFDHGKMIESQYRPFVERQLYFEKHLNEMQYLLQQVYPSGAQNPSILISGAPASKPFQALAANTVFSYDMLEKTETLPRYRFSKGERIDNITDWAVDQFRNITPRKTKSVQSPKMAYFSTSTVSCTILYIAINMHRISSANSRAFRSTPIFGNGPDGAINSWRSTSVMRRSSLGRSNALTRLTRKRASRGSSPKPC